MWMDSERLSRRTRQPGHDRTFLTSESTLSKPRGAVSTRSVTRSTRTTRPDRVFGTEVGPRALGLQPEASIMSKATKRKFFVEVKKQGPAGNAEERGFKHHTVQFYRLMSSSTATTTTPT